MKTQIVYVLSLLLMGMSCSSKTDKSTPEEAVQVSVPEFNADSAYYYTEQQVAFGPRVPNTQAHVDCGNYLADELRRHGAQVIEQEVILYNYANTPLNAKNIIGSFSPEKTNRILLCGHWDSRPYADRDPNPDNYNTPIDGANDGAGACAALLEMARHFGKEAPDLGIDIIFFDAEDWGVPEFDTKNTGGWCLGSEYWAKNPHVHNYFAKYGILLDMVSAKGAEFRKEGYSRANAKNVLDKVWKTASKLGYGNYFIDSNSHAIVDDHIEVMKYRDFPCIDIVQQILDNETGFGPYWHTLEDNMDSVDKKTLKAVGQTVLHVVYNER